MFWFIKVVEGRFSSWATERLLRKLWEAASALMRVGWGQKGAWWSTVNALSSTHWQGLLLWHQIHLVSMTGNLNQLFGLSLVYKWIQKVMVQKETLMSRQSKPNLVSRGNMRMGRKGLLWLGIRDRRKEMWIGHMLSIFLMDTINRLVFLY